MKRKLNLIVTILAVLIFGSSVMAQKNTKGASNDKDVKEFTKIINSEEFQKAEKSNDIEAMKRMLKGKNITVVPADPQLVPVCTPPYGNLVWGWHWVIGPNGGYFAYGQYCSKGGGSVKADLLPNMDVTRTQNIPKEHRAYFAAFEKASKLQEFKDAVKTGDAKRAKSLLIDNGAPKDIVLVVNYPANATSDPIPADTPNGNCSMWKLFTWWSSIPAPGHYYTTWQCVGLAQGGVIIWSI